MFKWIKKIFGFPCNHDWVRHQTVFKTSNGEYYYTIYNCSKCKRCRLEEE